MARNNQNNRGGNRNNRSNNNNPEGRNQYNSGFMGMARERPATAAAVTAGAVAAGVFLWSRRAQISDQLSQISDQIGEWTDNMSSDNEFETVGMGSSMGGSRSRSASEFGGSELGGSAGTTTGGSSTKL